MINRTSPTTIDIDRLAWTIADKGVHTIPTAVLRELGFEARAAGVKPVFTEILLDESAPPVARQRAFGQIAPLVTRWRNHASPQTVHPNGDAKHQVSGDASGCGRGVAA